tara:strand:+ start:25565 stop:26614 length:1050 start_codon:yes stop_codon:yes gene_type:complete
MFTWFEQVFTFLNRGGFVMWPLAASTLVLWYALGFRFLTLRRGTMLSLEQLIEQVKDGSLSRPSGVLDAAAIEGVGLLREESTQLRTRLDEAFIIFEEELGRYALWVKIIVIIAPLAGLLGTVSGMIETFDALGDMALFTQSGGIAGGVAQALITTQMGLAVAIPGLLIGQVLQRRQEVLFGEIEQLKELICAAQAPALQQMPTAEEDEARRADMRFSRRRKQEADGIDISPLIDMVFILLIFFMVTTTFVKDMQLELERPSAKSASRASTKAIRVHLDRSGAIYVDGLAVKVWMLQSRIRDSLKSEPSRPVLVITDRTIQAQKLIEVVDQCRLAGAKDVGVATLREAG